MECIGDEVRLALRRFGGVEGMDELISAWPSVVGDAVARNAWPARMARDGTLHVATSSSAWAFELMHLEGEIRGRLDVALDGPTPRRLRFAPGRLPEPGPEAVPQRSRTPLRPGPEELSKAAEIASAISDDELRKLVARAAAASLAGSDSGRPL